MKILIDINHPAHVHLYKNFARVMQGKGHKILFTCRDKEFEIELLKTYDFDYKSFGRKYISKIGKIWGLIEFDTKEFIEGLKFKPDIFLSHGSMYAAHAAFVLKKPHISLEDTFNFEQIRFYKPFTNAILIADYENPMKNDPKSVKYAGYHELAYLHPNRFTPDKSVLNEIGVNENEPFVLFRFVSWKATHDYGHKGISLENKLKAIIKFEKFGKVFISSESELDDELKPYKIAIQPEKIHHLTAYSSLMFGESSTMAEEAAILGIPSIFIFNNSTIYTTHLEDKYGLMFNFSESYSDQEKAIQKGIELLQTSDIKSEWQKKRQKMLSEKIDVTAFLVWFVENYPESFRIMKENTDYQYNFK